MWYAAHVKVAMIILGKCMTVNSFSSRSMAIAIDV
jgi:hypothetical protein